MAPIRRYLRITKYSVLECRIYLENPALAQSWLLNPRDPVLPKVIESVRPLVLPKLREEQERERSRRKSSKKKNIKDVVIEDDFETSIFLMETNTRHSLLHKRKYFRDKVQTKLTSNSSKLTGASRDAPVDIDAVEGERPLYVNDDDDTPDGGAHDVPPIFRRESEEDEPILLDDIPAAGETAAEDGPTNRRSKRRRGPPQPGNTGGGDGDASSDENPGRDSVGDSMPGTDDSSADELFVSDGDDSEDPELGAPPTKRRKAKGAEADDKKKLAMDISYEGFAIYGRVLCLVVKRRNAGTRGGPASAAMPPGSVAQSQPGQPGGQAVMENWITSTQLQSGAIEESDAP